MAAPMASRHSATAIDRRIPQRRPHLRAHRQRLAEVGGDFGLPLRVLPDGFTCAQYALLALHREHLLFGGGPLHEEPGRLLVLAGLGHGQAPDGHGRAVLPLGPAREERVADLTYHLRLLRVLDHREERVGVRVHGRLALREDRRGLVPVVVLGARRAVETEQAAVELERLDAVLVVEHRLAVGAEPGAAHRVQVGRELRTWRPPACRAPRCHSPAGRRQSWPCR